MLRLAQPLILQRSTPSSSPAPRPWPASSPRLHSLVWSEQNILLQGSARPSEPHRLNGNSQNARPSSWESCQTQNNLRHPDHRSWKSVSPCQRYGQCKAPPAGEVPIQIQRSCNVSADKCFSKPGNCEGWREWKKMIEVKPADEHGADLLLCIQHSALPSSFRPFPLASLIQQHVWPLGPHYRSSSSSSSSAPEPPPVLFLSCERPRWLYEPDQTQIAFHRSRAASGPGGLHGHWCQAQASKSFRSPWRDRTTGGVEVKGRKGRKACEESGMRKGRKREWRGRIPGRTWMEECPFPRILPCVWTAKEEECGDSAVGVDWKRSIISTRENRSHCASHLFSFSDPHPQFQPFDEELNHLIILWFNGWTVQLSLLSPEDHSSVNYGPNSLQSLFF